MSTDHDPGFHGYLTARDMAAADRVTAEINAQPVEARHADAFAALTALGFSADLGVAWTLDLTDGTTLVVSGVDEHGEPGDVSTDGPAFVQRLRDPNDHATIIDDLECSTFADALEAIRGRL
jgi:hypothetical protein